MIIFPSTHLLEKPPLNWWLYEVVYLEENKLIPFPKATIYYYNTENQLYLDILFDIGTRVKDILLNTYRREGKKKEGCCFPLSSLCY